MDKQQKELIIAIAVVIIAITMVFGTIKKVIRHRPRRGRASAVTVTDIASGKDRILSSLEEPKVIIKGQAKDIDKDSAYDVRDLDWGRDPFVLDLPSLFSTSLEQSWTAKMEQISRLQLSGMIISESNLKDSIAVIDGENLKVGDKISGFVIKEIRSNFVILESGNENFILRLWEEESERKKNLQEAPQ